MKELGEYSPKMLKKPMNENLNIIKATEEKIAQTADSIKNGKYPDTYFWLTLKKLFLETNF